MVGTLIPFGAGALLALGFVLFARRLGREPLVYGLGLIVAAAVYPVAAAVAGVWGNLGFEALGFALFGLAGVLGLRGRLWPLAAGWALHGVLDVGLYVCDRGVYIYSWYETLCAGFDLVLAVYLVTLIRRAPAARAPEPRGRPRRQAPATPPVVGAAPEAAVTGRTPRRKRLRPLLRRRPGAETGSAWG
jgi:hypothetical protein